LDHTDLSITGELVHNHLMMTPGERVALAAVVVLVDLVLIVVPLTALVVGYVILARPPWFRAWVERLYQGP